MGKTTIQISSQLHSRLSETASKFGYKIGWLADRIIERWLDRVQGERPANDSGIAQIPAPTELGDQLEKLLADD